MAKQFLKIPEDVVGERLDRYLRRLYPKLSFMSIAKLLRVGDVRINQKKVDSSYRLQEEDELRLPPATVLAAYEKPEKPQPYRYSEDQLKDFQSWILYEDKDVLVLNKPEGIAVQGGTGTFRHVDGLLRVYGKIKGESYKLLHRLDRDTSGILIVAKSVKAAHMLSTQFSGREVRKEYLAITCGIPNPMVGTIDAPMAKLPGSMGERMEITPAGDEAITEYEVIDSTPDQFALVKLCPHTGRTHQLRVHLAYIDSPILGDLKYNPYDFRFIIEQLSLEIPNRLYLHAHRLAVLLPNGKSKEFIAPLSDEWGKAMKCLNFSVKKEVL